MAAAGKPVEDSLYFYAPTKVAPPIFAACFLVTACTHIWQCRHYKSWSITALHPLCAFMFTAGFAIRAYDAWNYEIVGTYIASTLLIYCAPPLLELANYHVRKVGPMWGKARPPRSRRGTRTVAEQLRHHHPSAGKQMVTPSISVHWPRWSTPVAGCS
jgi:hypothetical protein